MSYAHNHHTAHNYDPGYPPEFDDPEISQVCGGMVDETCNCPECKECASVGDPECYAKGHMKPMHDSIQSLIDHEGCGTTLGENFHATERHSSPCHAVWIVLRDGTKHGSCETGNRELVDKLPTYTRIHKVGVSGIAWDGSDWEFYEEIDAGNDWTGLDALKQNLEDALAEHAVLEEEQA